MIEHYLGLLNSFLFLSILLSRQGQSSAALKSEELSDKPHFTKDVYNRCQLSLTIDGVIEFQKHMKSARLATQISVASPSTSHHHMLLNSYFLWNYMYFINLQRCFPSVLKRLSSCKVRNRLRAQAVSSCPFKTNQNREKWVISLKKTCFTWPI